MRRISRGAEILGVTTVTIRGRAFELSIDVARGALERRVRSRQGEAGELQVVKFGAKPSVRAMAGFASSGKS